MKQFFCLFLYIVTNKYTIYWKINNFGKLFSFSYKFHCYRMYNSVYMVHIYSYTLP